MEHWNRIYSMYLPEIQYQRSLIQALYVLQTYFKISIWPILTKNKLLSKFKKKSHLYAMQLFC